MQGCAIASIYLKWVIARGIFFSLKARGFVKQQNKTQEENRIEEQTRGLTFPTLLADVLHENWVSRLLQMAPIIWHSSFPGDG